MLVWGSAVIEEVCCLLQRTGARVRKVWLGGMRLYRKYAAIQEVHACAGGVRLYRMGDIIWQVRRL